MGGIPNPSAVASLPRVMDLTAAAPLAATVLHHRGASVLLDGSGVERMGAQCLQILLAARAAWAADGHVLTIDAASDALVEAATTMGAALLLFEPALEKPQ